MAPEPFGSDANPGTSVNTAFGSINKAANSPGVTAVIIRGGIYRETVKPSTDGISFSAYNNEAVTINGTDVITGWKTYTGNSAGGTNGNGGGAIFVSTNMTWSLNAGKDNQIFVDGLMLDLARTPNNPNRELVTSPRNVVDTATFVPDASASGAAQSCTFTDTSISTQSGVAVAANFYVGGLFHQIGSGEDGGSYGMGHTNVITASNGNSITMNMTVPTNSYKYRPSTGTLYYIDGVAALLDSPGEWFRLSTGELLLWTPAGDSPANHVVEAKRRDHGFNLAGRSNISITGIRLFACSIFTDYTSANNTFSNMDIIYPSHFGTVKDVYEDGTATIDWDEKPAAGSNVAEPGSGAFYTGAGVYLSSSNSVFKNSSVAYAPGAGVAVGGKNNRVLNNLIHDVAYMGVEGAGVTTGHCEVDLSRYSSVAGTEIANNTIYNSSRGLVQMRGLYAGYVHHNHMWNGMLNTYDYGALYALNHDHQASQRLMGPGGGFSRISRNRIHSTPPWGGKASVGVYLDNDSSDYVVDHNVIRGGTSAIMLTATTFDPPNDAEAYVGVDPSANDGLNFTGNITLSAWIQPMATISIYPRNIIRHGPQGNNEVFLRVNNGFYEVGSSQTIAGNKATTMARYAQPTVDLNNWVHITGIYDGTQWILYRNGVRVATQAASFGAVATTAPGVARGNTIIDRMWMLGGMLDWNEDSFEGYMDEVRIYQGALTDAQVTTLYNNAVPAVTSPTVLQLHFGFDNYVAGSRDIIDSTGLKNTVVNTSTKKGRTSYKNVTVATVARNGNSVNKVLYCPPSKAWHGMHIYNNTCDGAIGYGSEVTTRPQSFEPQSKFFNNIALTRSTHIWFDPGDRASAGIKNRSRRVYPTLEVDKNYCTYGIGGDPDLISLSSIGFVNKAAYDYRLLSTSTLLGMGRPITIDVPDTTQSLVNGAYPTKTLQITTAGDTTPDIGAYEGGDWISGATTLSSGLLPDGWSYQDIGINSMLSPVGYTGYSNNNYYVSGGGNGIGAASDSFHFASIPLTGDGEVAATILHLESSNQNDSASAGLMMRASNATNSTFVSIALDKGGINFVTRGTTASPATGSITLPATGSSIGANMTYVVMANASCAEGGITEVVFRANGVYIAKATTAPYFVNWTPTTTGNYTLTASITNSSGTVTAATPSTVTVSGTVLTPTCTLTAPLSGTTGYTNKPILLSALGDVAPGNVTTGSGTTAARSISKIAFRYSLNGGAYTWISGPTASPYASSFTPTVAGTYTFRAQLYDNAGTAVTSFSQVVTVQVLDASTLPRPPIQLKLTRAGNVYTGSYSMDGSTWTSAGSSTITTLPSTLMAGMAVSTFNDQRLHTAIFGSLKLNGTAYPKSLLSSNAVPQVNSGSTPAAVAGTPTNLTGTSSDDGLPNPPAMLTTTWSKLSGPGTVAFGNANSAATTATFSIAGSYVLRLSATDGSATVSDDLAITVLSAYAAWLTGYPNLIGNSALTTADPDADDLSNLLEYALGGDPTAASNAPSPTVGTNVFAGGTYLTLSFVPRRADITYSVEASSDLTTWTAVAMPSLTVGQKATVQDTNALSASTKRFLRLKVTQ